MGMTIDEVIKWLTIMKANLNSFPEVSSAKKIEALAEAIRLLKNEESEKPTGSDDCISRQDVLSEIIRFSTEEGSSVECQQLYCDVNNMPSITPIRPKAHWILDETDNSRTCSNCNCQLWTSDILRGDACYCPNCGAKMDGGEA